VPAILDDGSCRLARPQPAEAPAPADNAAIVDPREWLTASEIAPQSIRVESASGAVQRLPFRLQAESEKSKQINAGWVAERFKAPVLKST
jgi:hypothetical protein